MPLTGSQGLRVGNSVFLNSIFIFRPCGGRIKQGHCEFFFLRSLSHKKKELLITEVNRRALRSLFTLLLLLLLLLLQQQQQLQLD